MIKDAEATDAETPSQKPVQAALSVLAVAAALALFYYGQIFFVTVIVASIIAFLLDPVVELFTKMRLPRSVASFLVCSIALMMVYLAGLGLYTESISIASDLPSYSERMNEIVDGAASRLDSFEKSVYQSLVPKRFQDGATQPQDPNAARNRRPAAGAARGTPAVPQEVRVRQEPTSLTSLAYQSLSSIYPIILMGCFVPFLVYFLLSWRDHLRWRFLQIFDGEDRQTADRAWAGVSQMVRAYVIGNFLLGVILAIASSILFASVKLPYWIVIGPISGFLSLVPYLGMPLAALPPLIAALPASRDPAIYLFLGVSTALLHLFAMNLLYPKMIGSRVHLNPLAATLSLMLWGTLWGGIGLLLGIPMTAALKAVCDNVDRLKPYGRLLGD